MNDIEEKNKGWENMIYLFSAIGIFLIALILIPYWNHFGSFTKSSSFSDWVSFSTYIYNFVILILTFINILLIAYIARIAQSFDNVRFRENIKLQQDYHIENRKYELKIKIINFIGELQKSMQEKNYDNYIISQAGLFDFFKLYASIIEVDDKYFNAFDITLNSIGDILASNNNTLSDELLNQFVEKKLAFINSIKF